MSQFAIRRAVQQVARRTYATAYKPTYKYKVSPYFLGISSKDAIRYTTLGYFGGVAGVFAFFFFAEIPRVRNDIMLQIPVLNNFFRQEIAPEDNPF